MALVIQPIPEIPPDLRDAARAGRLVPFVGAGASRLADGPSWDGFAHGILRQLVDLKALNHSEYEQLRSRPLSPRVKLSIARSIADKAKVELDYSAVIQPKGERPERGRHLYAAISRLANSFVTTNYDSWLDRSFAVGGRRADLGAADLTVAEPSDREVHFSAERLSFAALERPNSVVHIHGSLREPHSMVMTTRQYLDRYGTSVSHENTTVDFLRALFKERVVLFIGYGLDELEILEYVLLKREKGATGRHFLLQPFFSHEQKVAEHLATYFQEDCGVTLLPYLCDDNDYDQLVNVLEHFGAEIPAEPLLAIQRRRDMEVLLGED